MSTDLSSYLVDLTTEQSNGRKGESPKTAFTKYNNLVSLISDWDQGSYIGDEAPTSTYAYLQWIDTSTTPPTIKRRDSEDTSWLEIGSYDQVINSASGYDATEESASGGVPLSDEDGRLSTSWLNTNQVYIPEPDLHIPFNDGLNIESGYGTNDQIDVSAAQDGSVMVDLPSRSVDFTRSTGCYYPNKSGVMVYADIDEPCITSRGVLWHSNVTNLINQSEDLSLWTAGSATVGSDGTLAPDGSTEAYYVDSSSEGSKQRSGSNSGTGKYCTYQYCIKAKTAEYGKLRWISYSGGTIQDYYAIINLSDGTILLDNSNISIVVTKLVDGWWLVSFTGKDNNTGNTLYRVDISGCSDLGRETGSVYVWGVQVSENQSGILPYIKTSGSTETITATNLTYPVEGNYPKNNLSIEFDMFCQSFYTDIVSVFDILNESTTTTVGGVAITTGDSLACFYAAGGQKNLDSFTDQESYKDNSNNKFVIVYDNDNSELRGYINGSLFSTEVLSEDITFPHDGYVRLGLWSIYRQPRNICGMKFYHTALTAEQVAALGAAE